LQNPAYERHSSKISHINTNSTHGKTDFDDITYISNHSGYMDMFFRVLPKAKMQILCESWSWGNQEFTTQYLSEKTFSLLLAGIPFISTHDYPLQLIERMLNVSPHPFYNEFKRCRTNGKLFAEFVDKFLQNFDENYKKCKEWSDIVHNELINKIEHENSLLDLIIHNELKTEFIIKKNLI
jgi:translation initiation factor 2 beta subunit (eIF-2beta)/eIF-5